VHGHHDEDLGLAELMYDPVRDNWGYSTPIEPNTHDLYAGNNPILQYDPFRGEWVDPDKDYPFAYITGLDPLPAIFQPDPLPGQFHKRV